jgi:hypothetical protein
MVYHTKLLSRKFNNSLFEKGRSPDLFYAIFAFPTKKSVALEVITSLKRGTESSSAKTYSCGNSSGFTPDSLLIQSIKE